MFLQWKARVEFHLHESFGRLRLSELFDILTEFPDSRPALEDLRVCLARTQGYAQVVAELAEVFQRRLLHPGANTSQVIDMYISTIRALQLLDPAGVLLDSVSGPLKAYLRGRRDTVRCIVRSLTDETAGGDLYEELGRGATQHGLIEQNEDSDDEAAGPGENW